MRNAHVGPVGTKFPWFIIWVYTLFGSLWIYGTDEVLGFFVHDPVMMTRIATVKGLFFVLATASLLYLLLKLYTGQLIKAELTRASD
ncbi:hypothetical protein WDW86_20840 [Bdellovibrionota bacterium FG-2]